MAWVNEYLGDWQRNRDCIKAGWLGRSVFSDWEQRNKLRVLIAQVAQRSALQLFLSARSQPFERRLVISV